ncbi:MAG: flagellar biosynthetic protein FliO [Pirellulaceae bacterium]|nr:flagellar biosynthetic protein FliO [Pirellulaceae bacterium]
MLRLFVPLLRLCLLVIGAAVIVPADVAHGQHGFDFPNQNRQVVAQTNYESTATPIAATPSFPSLAPRSHDDVVPAEGSKSKSFGPLITTSFSLVVVLGLFAGLVWITRRYGNGSMTQGAIPSDVMKSLGSTPIDARTRVTMLLCGNRIIVMAQTASGVHPLSEITDPAEVHRLTAACTGQAHPSFAETLRQTDSHTSVASEVAKPRRQLFASS